MTIPLRQEVIFDDTAAVTGEVFKATHLFDPTATRSFQIEVDTDTIDLKISIDGVTFISFGTYTENTLVDVTGAWAFFRIVKSGALNAAKVTAHI